MTPRYERIKVDRQYISDLQFWKSRAEQFDEGRGEPDSLPNRWEAYLFALRTVALEYYLYDQIAEAAGWGRSLVTATQRYFIGNWWLLLPDRGASYLAAGGGNWVCAFRAAVGFASAVGELKALRCLAEYPTDHKPDAGTLAQDTPWYLLLAEYLARGPTATYRTRLEAVQEGASKHQKILAALLGAIVDGRGDLAGVQFEEHMRYYMQIQRRSRDLDVKLAVDATILAHLAERLGHPIGYDEKWRDYLIYL